MALEPLGVIVVLLGITFVLTAVLRWQECFWEERFLSVFTISLLLVGGFSLAILGVLLFSGDSGVNLVKELTQTQQDGLVFLGIGLAVVGMAMNLMSQAQPEKNNEISPPRSQGWNIQTSHSGTIRTKETGPDLWFWGGLGAGIVSGVAGNLVVTSTFLLIEPIESVFVKAAIYVMSWGLFIWLIWRIFKAIERCKTDDNGTPPVCEGCDVDPQPE